MTGELQYVDDGANANIPGGSGLSGTGTAWQTISASGITDANATLSGNRGYHIKMSRPDGIMDVGPAKVTYTHPA